jgi:DNA-binding transcriptional regulator/RsmH inhibitor MraZ
MRVDGRGRVTLPAWLRQAGEYGSPVLVAARRPDARVVLVTPAALLDAFVEGLTGEAL